MTGFRLCLALITLLPLAGVSGQALQPLPSDSLHALVSLGQANEVIIEFANPGPDSLHLRWKLLGADLPAGWDVDLCDYGSCYTGIPATATMVPAGPGSLPFLKLIVQPGLVKGEGSATFRVYLVKDIAQWVTVHFSFSAQSSTPVTTIAASVRAFPNPATQTLYVHYDGGEPFLEGRVLGPDGRPFGSSIRLLQGLNTLDLSDWPLGLSHLLLSPVIHLPILKQ